MGDGGNGNTGGDGSNTSGSGWNDESSSTLWGWLDGVVSGLKTIWQTLTDLPQLIWNFIKDIPSMIWDFFKDSFDTISTWLSDIWDSLKELPTKILDGLKEIFIPDAQVIEDKFLAFVEDFGSIFGANFNAFDTLFKVEKPLEDVTTDYYVSGVGSFKLKILEKDWLHKGVAYFRPVIRGWLTLLLVIFSWNNILGLIRQAMPIAPSSPTETESITISKSEKLSNGWTKTTSKSTRSRK